MFLLIILQDLLIPKKTLLTPNKKRGRANVRRQAAPRLQKRSSPLHWNTYKPRRVDRHACVVFGRPFFCSRLMLYSWCIAIPEMKIPPLLGGYFFVTYSPRSSAKACGRAAARNRRYRDSHARLSPFRQRRKAWSCSDRTAHSRDALRACLQRLKHL